MSGKGEPLELQTIPTGRPAGVLLPPSVGGSNVNSRKTKQGPSSTWHCPNSAHGLPKHWYGIISGGPVSKSFPTNPHSSQRDPKAQRKSECFALLIATCHDPYAGIRWKTGWECKAWLIPRNRSGDPTHPSPLILPNLNLRTSVLILRDKWGGGTWGSDITTQLQFQERWKGGGGQRGTERACMRECLGLRQEAECRTWVLSSKTWWPYPLVPYGCVLGSKNILSVTLPTTPPLGKRQKGARRESSPVILT